MRTERGLPTIGGASASALADAYGTPLLAIDTDVVDARIARFADVGARLGIDVCYAAKALLFVELARRIVATPLGIDVCSLGELLTAERAGIPAERIVMHGCAKTDREIAAIASGRAGRVVVDNADEIERLGIAARPGTPVRVLLRINTGIEAHTHAYVRTGGEDSKFGFARADVGDAIAATLARPDLRLVGFHSHLGSQLFDARPYAASVAVLMDAYARAPGGERIDLEATLADVADVVTREARARGLAIPRIGIEPGRGIVAEAGTSLYRVAVVKAQGTRRFAIVDGGIADNPRPALYGAYHHPFLAGRSSAASDVEFTVCGRSCENDRLVVAPLPADLAPGDLLALGTTGAYTYSMASNYNRFPKPAVAFAGGGEHRLVVRRERDEDTLRNDVL
jgi:diaminopimelate decarboxylase